MSIWNAPSPVASHAKMACHAALNCRAGTEKLFRSVDWRGLPKLETRFGIHRGEVMVGHFGASNRMNFTAIGDGVNLASRLEGLNKQYGTAIMVSEAVYEQAVDEFEFRLLDWVAVKGRDVRVKVYELVGLRNQVSEAMRSVIRNYEAGFAAYQQRDFKGALSLFAAQPEDKASQIMADRCREFAAHPPPEWWDRAYISSSK